jgi:hypothetical protein
VRFRLIRAQGLATSSNTDVAVRLRQQRHEAAPRPPQQLSSADAGDGRAPPGPSAVPPPGHLPAATLVDAWPATLPPAGCPPFRPAAVLTVPACRAFNCGIASVERHRMLATILPCQPVQQDIFSGANGKSAFNKVGCLNSVCCRSVFWDARFPASVLDRQSCEENRMVTNATLPPAYCCHVSQRRRYSTRRHSTANADETGAPFR